MKVEKRLESFLHASPIFPAQTPVLLITFPSKHSHTCPHVHAYIRNAWSVPLSGAAVGDKAAKETVSGN